MLKVILKEVVRDLFRGILVTITFPCEVARTLYVKIRELADVD